MSVVGLSFLVAVIFQQGAVGLPVAMGEAGFTPADYGLAIAVNGVLIVALQIPVTRFIEHRDAGRLLVVSSVLAGYGFGLTAFAGSIGVFALTVCVWTLAEIVNAPTQTSLVVRLSPVHGRGRYQGMYTMSWSVAALVAPVMSGVVIDRWGAEWLWGLCAVVGTVAGTGYWLLMRRMPEGGLGATVEDPPGEQAANATNGANGASAISAASSASAASSSSEASSTSAAPSTSAASTAVTTSAASTTFTTSATSATSVASPTSAASAASATSPSPAPGDQP
jgi:dipeptide/tripeptide permease